MKPLISKARTLEEYILENNKSIIQVNNLVETQPLVDELVIAIDDLMSKYNNIVFVNCLIVEYEGEKYYTKTRRVNNIPDLISSLSMLANTNDKVFIRSINIIPVLLEEFTFTYVLSIALKNRKSIGC